MSDEHVNLTSRGIAVAEMLRQGFSLQQVHEIETGCSADDRCARCRRDFGENQQ